MRGPGARVTPAVAGRLLLLNLFAAALTLTGAAMTQAARHPESDTFAALLVAVAGWALLGALVWLQLIVVTLGIETLSRGRVRAGGWLGAPAGLRRTLLTLCGTVALAGSTLAGPAHADPTPTPATPSTQSSATPPGPATPSDPVSADTSEADPSPDPPLPAPERPASGDRLERLNPGHSPSATPRRPTQPPPQARTGSQRSGPAHPTSRPPGQPEGRAERTVLVRRGDTLWDLAASRLPSTASLAEVAGATQALYDANRDQLGDPDLIRPGQRLRLPAPGPPHPPRQEY